MALFTLKDQKIDSSWTPTYLPPWLGITKRGTKSILQAFLRKPRKYGTEKYCVAVDGSMAEFLLFSPRLRLGMRSADPMSICSSRFFSSTLVSEPSAELRVEFSVGVEFRGCAYSLRLAYFFRFLGRFSVCEHAASRSKRHEFNYSHHPLIPPHFFWRGSRQEETGDFVLTDQTFVPLPT